MSAQAERFRDIIGRADLRDRLQQSLRTGRISHAYILEGEPRSGKRYLADLFSRALVCEQLGEDPQTGLLEPCGCCSACTRVLAGTHPDVLTITHEKETSIGVDEIRKQLVGQSQISAYEGGRRIYIVPDSEIMTGAAQNALLKTLEEPTPGVTILLLARSAGLLLPTIVSRCVLLSLRPIGEDALTGFLMKHRHIVDYRARIAAAFSQGSIGRAIDLAESDRFERFRRDAVTLIMELPRLTTHGILERLRTLTGDAQKDGDDAQQQTRDEKQPDIQTLLDVCAWLLRDALVCAASDMSAPEGHLILTDQILYSKKIASILQPDELVQLLLRTEEVRRQLAVHVNEELAMELFLLSWKGRMKEISA